MSLKFRDKNGNETPIAGLNGTSGELVPSVSYYQHGEVTIVGSHDEVTDTPISQIVTGQWYRIRVTLPTPMPDADYLVVLDFGEGTPALQLETEYIRKEAFDIGLYRPLANAWASTDTIRWQAFKLMTDESRALDEQAIATNTAAIATNTKNIADNTKNIADNTTDITELQNKFASLGKYSFSGIKVVTIPANSTTAQTVSAGLKLSANKYYLFLLHALSHADTGSVVIASCTSDGTPLAYWETALTLTGFQKCGTVCAVRVTTDTPLYLKVTPRQAQGAQYSVSAEIGLVPLTV